MLALCNRVLRASGAGSGARGTKSHTGSRINREAPKWYSNRWEEGVEETRWEPVGLQGCCRDIVINVFKVFGRLALQKKIQEEMNASLSSAEFGCRTVNSAWSHVTDNKNY